MLTMYHMIGFGVMESIKPLIRNTLVYTCMWADLPKLAISLHRYFRISFPRASGKKEERRQVERMEKKSEGEKGKANLFNAERVQTEIEEQE